MKNFLNSVKVFKPRSNVFDLTHDVKLSTEMGRLTPVCVIDCVPGDRFRIGCEALIRFAPMVAPVMHRFDVTVHYFFVPKRLLWDNWENFRTNTEVAGSLPAVPIITIEDTVYGRKLADYLGLPDPVGVPYTVNAMPFAAYNKIYNEYYRDQNLVTAIVDELVDGDNDANLVALTTMRNRAWEHDYFTAALPWPQKGDAVEIPISGDVVLKTVPGAGLQKYVNATTGADVTTGAIQAAAGPSVIATGAPNVDVLLDPDGTMEVQNADTSINDLRRAYALQRFLEKLARGGSRMTEFIRTMFGVISSDARLQRPEYITGFKSPVVISEVLNTSNTAEAPQGNMAGHGASVASGKYGKYFCEEDGYIIGIMSVMPKTAYQQGIPKHFLKVNDPYEVYVPDFANIGEQEILNKEVYVNHSQPNGTFGYIPRYGEYKFEQNRVAGQFKIDFDYWHAGRIFETEPNLNSTFVTSNPTTRIFAVDTPDYDHLWCHVLNDIKAVRSMPKYGTPTF